MAAYPDLRGGRFAVIADFEDPKHMEILQLISVSPKAKCVLSQRHGRAETGGGCVQFTAGSPDDAIVINNDRAENWNLNRDWQDYDLLLFGIESPKRDLTAEITISAGPANEPIAVYSYLRLERGWNLARLDLAEVGERIPLDDVRGLRFSVSGARKPVKLNRCGGAVRADLCQRGDRAMAQPQSRPVPRAQSRAGDHAGPESGRSRVSRRAPR
jgi:hypothetical protein